MRSNLFGFCKRKEQVVPAFWHGVDIFRHQEAFVLLCELVFFCHCYFGLLSNLLLTYKSDIMGQTQITTFLVLILGYLHNFRDRAISTGFELLKGGFIFLKGIG